jgi:menaquinol-cytochrome c reductase iron-sulfur subunit
VVATADVDVTGRRAFLARVIGACLAFIGAALGIPALGAVVAPALKPETPVWFPLGPQGGFQDGIPRSVEITVPQTDGWIQTTQVKAVWVVRQGDQFTVFNGRCTHLGCAYSWQADENEFTCPCHAGVYALDGHVLAGPPPRSLDSLPVRVDGGQVQVQYQDYSLGTPDKAPA